VLLQFFIFSSSLTPVVLELQAAAFRVFNVAVSSWKMSHYMCFYQQQDCKN
jgi:hypothetical protein